jgi:hypothetical protein
MSADKGFPVFGSVLGLIKPTSIFRESDPALVFTPGLVRSTGGSFTLAVLFDILDSVAVSFFETMFCCTDGFTGCIMLFLFFSLSKMLVPAIDSDVVGTGLVFIVPDPAVSGFGIILFDVLDATLPVLLFGFAFCFVPEFSVIPELDFTGEVPLVNCPLLGFMVSPDCVLV